MRNIKVAVIGSGFMGAAHIEALYRIGGVTVGTIVSKDHDRAEEISKVYGIRNISADWKQVLQDPEIEAVHNCTPNDLHYELNRAFLEAGKHIISEKPLTTSSAESEKLVSLADKKGVVTAINFNYRFYPLIQQVRHMVESGEIGKIYLIHGTYLQDWLFYNTDYNWRLESKISGKSRAVADIGSHWCDLIQYVTGQEIKSVFADLFTIHETRKKPLQPVETFKGKEQAGTGESSDIAIDTEDAGTVMFRFGDGTRGVFTVSQVSAGRKNHFQIEIDGSRKAIAWNQEEPNNLWIGYREKSNEIMIKDPSLLSEQARSYAHYPGGHPEGYADGPKNLFIRFYDFIRSGQDPRKIRPDFPTFSAGHLENKIVDAVLRSNNEQRWIDV